MPRILMQIPECPECGSTRIRMEVERDESVGYSEEVFRCEFGHYVDPDDFEVYEAEIEQRRAA